MSHVFSDGSHWWQGVTNRESDGHARVGIVGHSTTKVVEWHPSRQIQWLADDDAVSLASSASSGPGTALFSRS